MCHRSGDVGRNVPPKDYRGFQVAGPDPLLLPDPNFDCTPADCQFIAGIRPYRQGSSGWRPKIFR